MPGAGLAQRGKIAPDVPLHHSLLRDRRPSANKPRYRKSVRPLRGRASLPSGTQMGNDVIQQRAQPRHAAHVAVIAEKRVAPGRRLAEIDGD